VIIKTQEQIEKIRNSAQIAAKALRMLDSWVKPGITTNSINDKATEFIKDHGGKPASLGYKGFPKEMCISVNDEICHGIPSDRVLVEGDIVNVDILVNKDGYIGDTCKMYEVGEISEEAKNLLKVAKECLDIGIEQVGTCRSFGNIGYYINKHAVEHGYSVVQKFCGHGVGCDIHEGLVVPHVAEKNSGTAMYKGMVFTIEPMINAGSHYADVDKEDGWTARTVDGSLSAQYEHTIAVTDSGADILSLLED